MDQAVTGLTLKAIRTRNGKWGAQLWKRSLANLSGASHLCSCKIGYYTPPRRLALLGLCQIHKICFSYVGQLEHLEQLGEECHIRE